MEKNAIIKLKKQLNVTDLAGEKVMIDFESGKYFLIKGAGNDIWAGGDHSHADRGPVTDHL